MATTFRFRRGTAAEWILRNPVLAAGEPGYVIGTNKLKIGDGATPWMLLPYVKGESVPSGDGTPVDLSEHINSTNPHPVYDDGPSFNLLYQNAKV